MFIWVTRWFTERLIFGSRCARGSWTLDHLVKLPSLLTPCVEESFGCAGIWFEWICLKVKEIFPPPLRKSINLLHHVVCSRILFKICITFFRHSENVYLKGIDYINKFRENMNLSNASIKVLLLFLAVLPEEQNFCSFGTMGLIPRGHKSNQSSPRDLYQRMICTTR